MDSGEVRMNYTDYEKQLLTALESYKAPHSSLDVLQTRFLTTLAILTGLLFLESIVSMASADTFGAPVLFLGKTILVALTLFSLIPYSIMVIKLALKKEDGSGFIESLGSPTGWMILRILGLLLIFSFIVLLPYFSAGYLEEQGSTSNLFVSFKILLLILAGLTIIFLLARVLGAIIAAVAGTETSIAEMFSKTRGHVLSIVLILIATLVPLELLTHIINYSLMGFLKMSESIAMQVLVALFQSFVRSVLILLQLYLLWTALSQYIKNQKLLA